MNAVVGRVAFQAGFLAGDLADPASLRLMGSCCRDCGIALFGSRRRCENCSSPNLTNQVFAERGTVFTYTIQRYRPPEPNALPKDWRPRPIAWIDLDNEGPRLLAPVDCDPEAIAIGSRVMLRCEVSWVDPDGGEIVAYKFVLDPPPEEPGNG